jgi:effector-binding domain-containing protein
MYPKEKELCTGHNGGGEKITSNYAKIFQTMSAFVLMLYNDVTSTTQL